MSFVSSCSPFKRKLLRCTLCAPQRRQLALSLLELTALWNDKATCKKKIEKLTGRLVEEL